MCGFCNVCVYVWTGCGVCVCVCVCVWSVRVCVSLHIGSSLLTLQSGNGARRIVTHSLMLHIELPCVR